MTKQVYQDEVEVKVEDSDTSSYFDEEESIQDEDEDDVKPFVRLFGMNVDDININLYDIYRVINFEMDHRDLYEGVPKLCDTNYPPMEAQMTSFNIAMDLGMKPAGIVKCGRIYEIQRGMIGGHKLGMISCQCGCLDGVTSDLEVEDIE